MANRLLKLVLFCGAVGWGVSIFGVVLPWSAAAGILNGLGAETITYDPMLDYWLRMTAGAFTIIGMLFAAVLVFPDRYGNLIPLLGILSIFEGVILLIHGLRLGLPSFPFYGDVTFCLFVGISLLILHPKAT